MVKLEQFKTRLEPVEPVVGRRYLVVMSFEDTDKDRLLGRTGICTEHYTKHPYKEVNTILKFDSQTHEDYNEYMGFYIWRNGVEIIELEDQNFIR